MATTSEPLYQVFDADLEKSGRLFTTAWTSDGSGNYTEQVVMRGWLSRFVTVPASGPTDDYDLTLIDQLTGIDILGGLGMNRDTSATEFYPHPSTNPGVTLIGYVNGIVTVTIAAAGSGETGTVYWFVNTR